MQFLTGPAKATVGGALVGATIACTGAWHAAAGGEAAVTHRVVIERFAFRPSTLRIGPGDAVVFVNRDLAPHTATGVGGTWSTKTLAKGMFARVVFMSPETTAYFCKFHPDMRGTIVIAAK